MIPKSKFFFRLITLLILMSMTQCSFLNQSKRQENILNIEINKEFNDVALKYFQNNFEKDGLEVLAMRLLENTYREKKTLSDSLIDYIEIHAIPYDISLLFYRLSKRDYENNILDKLSQKMAATAIEYASDIDFKTYVLMNGEKLGRNIQENENALFEIKSRIFLNYANYLIVDGEVDSALKLYETMLDKYISHDILLAYSEILNHLNRYQEAMENAINALEIQGLSPKAEKLIIQNARILVYKPEAIREIISTASHRGITKLSNDIQEQHHLERLPNFIFETNKNKLSNNQDFQSDLKYIFLWDKSSENVDELIYNLLKKKKNYPGDLILINCDKNAYREQYEIINDKAQTVLFGGPKLPYVFKSKKLPSLYVCDANYNILFHFPGINNFDELSLKLSTVIKLIHPEL
ncbi:MAG: hypothetical protein KAI81_10135 [Candidatus Marinimicrobia bacterium]|nr:hypothetical protein [Candidatus Neomarinimicrobiota bacterium]